MARTIIHKPKKVHIPNVRQKRLGSHHKKLPLGSWANADAAAFERIEAKLFTPDKLKRARPHKFMSRRHPRRKLI